MSEFEIKGSIKPGFERIAEAFEDNFETFHDLGASAAVMHEGEMVADIHAGWTDESRTKAWQEDTLVNAWSSTKGFLSIGIHMLMDRGLLELDEPVSTHWPEFAQNGKENITLRHLLTHRAGLASWGEDVGVDILYDWDRAVKVLEETTPLWEPGTASGYHPLSYGFLLGELFHRTDGRDAKTFVMEDIVAPLGLDFHIGMEESMFDRLAEISMVPTSSSISSEAKSEMTEVAVRAFTNPLARVPDSNTPEWRKAVIFAANGHTTARSLAKLYGILSQGDNELLTEEKVNNIRTEGPKEMDLVLGQRSATYEICWGLGFQVNVNQYNGPNKRAFFQGGFGGSMGVCDPENSLGFGYAMNRLDITSRSGHRAANLLKAIYDCLGFDWKPNLF